MTNSASQAIAEFKSQRMGGLLSGTSSVAGAPQIGTTSLSDTASARLARSAPKKSSTAFLSQMRDRSQSYHATAMQGIAQKRAREQAAANQAAFTGAVAGIKRSTQGNGGGGGSSPTGYRLPSGNSGERPSKRGAYGYQPFQGRSGLTAPASNALTALERAYQQAWGTGFVVNNGWRSIKDEQYHWDRYQAGVGPIASKPGTGVHGYGTAVDLNGPISNASSKQHAWLRQNAAQFGWHWVGQRFGEPWHWEYYG